MVLARRHFLGLALALLAVCPTPTAVAFQHRFGICNYNQHEPNCCNLKNHVSARSLFIPRLARSTKRSPCRQRSLTMRSLQAGTASSDTIAAAGIDSKSDAEQQPHRHGDQFSRRAFSAFPGSGRDSRGGALIERFTETCHSDHHGCASAPLMTRSRAIASIFSSMLMMVGGGLLGPARSIAAAPTDAAEAAAAGADAAQGPAQAEPVYAMGPDEFGVLFGDGPIGIKLGDNPLKASGVCRVFVTEVIENSQAVRNPNLHAGLGVAAVGGTPAASLEPKQVAELIRVSRRPTEIIFSQLAGINSCFAYTLRHFRHRVQNGFAILASRHRDPELLGKRLQAEADKKYKEMRLQRQKNAVEQASAPPPSQDSPGELRVTLVGEKPKDCGTRTKAGDLIEFRYSGRLASDLSVEFDSSDRRGTGLPYAVVLGNGDVVKGLDLSLFDMCVGERRRIEIPARLAYGKRGSKVFGIPPEDGTGSGAIVFGVELVSINFRSDASDKRDNFYTDDPCDAAAVAAGNTSGKCRELSSTTAVPP